MNRFFIFFFDIFRFHKLKIAAVLIAFLVFLVLLFPFDDLSDLVTAQVAKMTQNQIFLQFSEPGLNFLPSPGLRLQDVRIETPFAPPLEVDSLLISPSLSSLLAFKLGLSMDADGLLGGEVSVSAHTSAMKGTNTPSQKVTLDGSDIDLTQVSALAGLPVRLKGSIEFESEGEFDLTWAQQPAVTLKLQGEKVQVPPDTVPTAMGPLPLPDLTFREVDLVGEISEGKLNIERANLGKEGDDLFGNIQGVIDLSIVNSGGRPVAQMGGYDLKLRLTVKKAIEKKVALFLLICDSVKKDMGDNIKYDCGLSAPNTMVPPKARAL